MNLFRQVILSTMFLCMVAACNNNEQPDNPTPVSTAPKFTKEGELVFYKPDGTAIVKINIEIAGTDAEQQQGLMNRPFMGNDQGMLFIFEADGPRSFWMRNTIIPLDILYVNSQLVIVDIAENAEPFSDKSLPSSKPAQYVVEVNAGFCAQYGIADGCTIKYTTR